MTADTPLEMLTYADWPDVDAAMDRIRDEVLAELGLPPIAEHRRVCVDRAACPICMDDAAPKGANP